ncbi:hypothetical protein SH2C18_07730 [Clostridium sediminicola]|uniref:hypothetical protein n=1 Tax=Clostridium sediminicola TaxID=3114879 RepID=UPI0031F27B42
MQIHKIIKIFIIIVLSVGTIIFVNKYRYSHDLLHLTKNEIRLYERYSKTEETKLLENLEPIIILKFYLFSIDNNDYLTTYKFYDNNHRNLMPSKQQYFMKVFRQGEELDSRIICKIKNHMKSIEKIKISENKCVIEIKYDDTEYISRFFFIKRENSIWKLRWMYKKNRKLKKPI